MSSTGFMPLVVRSMGFSIGQSGFVLAVPPLLTLIHAATCGESGLTVRNDGKLWW
jgi:hypothetical protein